MNEQVTGDRWIRRRRRDEIGYRRRCGGSVLAATPYLNWKLHGGESARGQPGGYGGAPAAVSARKLAASLWQLAATTHYSVIVRRRRRLFDRLGFEAELFKAQKRIKELEAKQNWRRTKLKQCTKKLDEERASLMRSQHRDTCNKIKDLKADIKREKKIFKKINFLNSKLVNDIAEAKLSAMKFKQNFEKEKKAREFLEDLCSDLAKEIEDRKGGIVALRNRCGRIEKEVDEERKMLQLAEVWREEQAQMKLADAKLILEEKYCQMNNLITEIEAFLRSSNLTSNCDKNTRDQESHKTACSEISSASLKQPKKKSSSVCKATNINLSRRISNGSISSIISQDDVAVEERYTECQWPAREPRNPHIVRAMKGDIEWPRRIQRQGLGGNILEAKLESQKMLLRNVLKQRS